MTLEEQYVELEAESDTSALLWFAAVALLFDRASSSVRRDVLEWFSRYGGLVTYADSKKRLTPNELVSFRRELDALLEEIPADSSFGKTLQRTKKRINVTRLDALSLLVSGRVHVLYEQFDLMDYLIECYEDQYKKSSKILKNDEVELIGTDEIIALLLTAWATDGLNFEQRLDMALTKLSAQIRNEITRGLIRGLPMDKIVLELDRRFDISKSNAKRLVLTEMEFARSLASLQSFKDAGVKTYKFVATIDRRTSDICRSMHLREFKISDFRIGVTAPPMHPRCRSVVTPI